jgi:hypothetical protein
MVIGLCPRIFSLARDVHPGEPRAGTCAREAIDSLRLLGLPT